MVLCVGVASFSLLQSMVNPVLPTIQAALDTDQATVTWVLTAYLVSASVFTPIIGRVGDKVGKERMLVVALAALAVGSLLAAVADQRRRDDRGPRDPGHRRRRAAADLRHHPRRVPAREGRLGAIGTAAALLAVGGGVGLVIAGPLVEALSYHWLFWIPMVMTDGRRDRGRACGCPSPRSAPPAGSTSARRCCMSGWLVALLVGVSQGHTGAGTPPA